MFTHKPFTDKVVIITGASSGIGRATAMEFAKRGASVVLAARSQDKLEQVAKEIEPLQVPVRVIPTDVASREQVAAMAQAVEKAFGRIDILINNAGGGAVGTVEDNQFADQARELLEVDFFGKVHCAQAVLPIMRRHGQGAIVNLSSVVGRKAFPKFGAYSSSMHAVSALSDTLRQELYGSGIQVTTVYPALTRTAFFSGFARDRMPAQFTYMKPLAPETVAKAIVKAVHKRSPRVILPWQPPLMLLGDTFSARFGDWFVRMLDKGWFMRLIWMYGQGPRFQRED